MTATGTARGLLGAAHPGPAVAVTVLAGLLAAVSDVSFGTGVLVVGAVLAGQLSIGWSNDLLDLHRDLAVGRADKPLTSGAVSVYTVRVACVVALVAAVVLSLACGLVPGLVALVVVAAGWVYNLGAKSTVLSWLPYAVAFGALPVFVHLAGAGQPGDLPPVWVPMAGALLGVGAHLVNVLPDLDDDAATGVRGLPHRLGARWTPPVAVLVLVAASATIVVGAARDGGAGSRVVPAVGLLLVAALALAALVSRGRAPFRAAMGIALVDVLMLVWAR